MTDNLGAILLSIILGLLATAAIRAVASSLAGVLWTLVSPTAAFIYVSGWMRIARPACT